MRECSLGSSHGGKASGAERRKGGPARQYGREHNATSNKTRAPTR